jgi:hypothetical protein
MAISFGFFVAKKEIAMTARLIQVENAQEALVVEQALAMYRELNLTCKLAPDGEVLNLAEHLAVQRGRELTRKALETVLNAQAEEVEKKGRRAERVSAKERGTTVAAARKRCSQRQGT